MLFGRMALVSVPLGLAIVVLCGTLYALLPVYNPWSIANIVGFLAMMFALGAACVLTVRLGKFRGKLVQFVIGAPAGLVFTLSTFEAIRRFSGSTLGPVAFHRERLSTGISLFGSSGVVDGWILALIWVAGGLGALWVAMLVTKVESQHPFCSACDGWARRRCWTFELQGPDPMALKVAQIGGRARDLLQIGKGGPPDRTLVTKVVACRCGGVAMLSALVRKTNDESNMSTTIVWGHEVSAHDLDETFRWAESLTSSPPPRPKLQVVERLSEEKELLDRPFEMPGIPESGEYASVFRWGCGVVLDAEADNEVTLALRKRLMLGDAEAAKIALSRVKHPSDRSFVAHACADWPVEPSWLGEWTRREPRSAEARLVRGIFGVIEAWKVRGVDWIPQNFDAFQDRLREADDDLEQAATLSPKDPTPWAWMLWTAKGLQLNIDEARRRFLEALARSPGHRAAHTFMLDYLKPRWFGSREQVDEFMQDTLRRARPGSHMLVAVPEAAYELAHFSRPGEPRTNPGEYFNGPGVAERIRRANELLFKSDRFKPNMDTPRARNWFAYALWQTGSLEEAAEHLRIIGPSTPWGPFPSPRQRDAQNSLRRARKECGVRDS